jgi:hypothetical protein
MSLDERQKVVTKTFTREQLEGMSVDDLVALVGEAGPNAKFHGKAVVRRPNGEIRYAKDAVPGEYGETAGELASQKGQSDD